MTHELIGRPVSEDEVATDLGFADVIEMRRWETEMGQKLADLERKIRDIENERDRFLWHGTRMQVVLEKIAESIEVNDPDIRLAIGVVLGKEVDWKHRLKGWFSNDI